MHILQHHSLLRQVAHASSEVGTQHQPGRRRAGRSSGPRCGGGGGGGGGGGRGGGGGGGEGRGGEGQGRAEWGGAELNRCHTKQMHRAEGQQYLGAIRCCSHPAPAHIDEDSRHSCKENDQHNQEALQQSYNHVCRLICAHHRAMPLRCMCGKSPSVQGRSQNSSAARFASVYASASLRFLHSYDTGLDASCGAHCARVHSKSAWLVSDAMND